MIKTKQLIVGALLVGAAGTTVAAPVSESKARQVAEQFLNNKSGTRNNVLEKIALPALSGTTDNHFYVFGSAQNNGFVIVAADDAVIPILGYSLDNSFPATNLSPEVSYWLNNYNRQINYVVEQDIKATEEVAGKWESLLGTNGNSAAKPTTVVSPLMTTTWDQGNYYNELCPGNGNQTTPTGCVATAMAQIMKYWNAPAEGTGSYSYNHPGYGQQSADFGATTYQWAVMPNNLNSTSSSVAVDAVSTLMYHCGVAVRMNYAPQGSGAQVIGWGTYPSALKAFKTYFGYKQTTSGVYREDYSTADWIALLKNEMDEARPLLYAGFDDNFNAGHAFVFDGYDENDLFHVNWGWSGYYNGYFSVDDLAPSGTGTGGGSGFYNDGQHAIINIEPINPNEITDSVAIVAQNTLTISANTIEQGDAFSVTADFRNSGTLDYLNGYLQAKVFESETNEERNYFSRLYNQNILSGEDTVITFSSNGLNNLEPGEYYIRIQYRDMNDNWLNISDNEEEDHHNKVALTVLPKPTGVTETEQSAQVNIYPNPASSTLTIDLSGLTSAPVAMICFDVHGKTIDAPIKMGQNGLALVDVHHLAEGIYFLRIQSEGTQLFKKFVVKH